MAGWTTARVNRPVLILGSLDGIETGVRQLIRTEPLETTTVSAGIQEITIPTEAEILRIKGFLLLRRNATRDYVDFAALADHVGRRGHRRPPPSSASTGSIPRTPASRPFSRCWPSFRAPSPTISMARSCPNTTTSILAGTAGTVSASFAPAPRPSSLTTGAIWTNPLPRGHELPEALHRERREAGRRSRAASARGGGHDAPGRPLIRIRALSVVRWHDSARCLD